MKEKDCEGCKYRIYAIDIIKHPYVCDLKGINIEDIDKKHLPKNCPLNNK